MTWLLVRFLHWIAEGFTVEVVRYKEKGRRGVPLTPGIIVRNLDRVTLHARNGEATWINLFGRMFRLHIAIDVTKPRYDTVLFGQGPPAG